MITLQPYAHQQSNIDAIREHFRRGVKSVLWYLPTGGGKSLATGFMLLKASNAGHRCWFIVHRRELIRQTENVFKELGLDYGVIAAGRTMQPWKLVQICSVNTLARQIDKREKPHLVAQDECHHLPCKSWSDVLNKIGRCYMV